MAHGFGFRAIAAIVIVGIAAIAAAFIAGNLQAGLIALVGGIAAVLMAAGTGESHPQEPIVEATASGPRGPDVGTVIAAIVEPVLIVSGGRVTQANAAARALLGGHIIGEDVRLAIRHPAAAERLANPGSGSGDGPINLVGLGTLDQRWEMRVADGPGGERIVHLIDQTGSYAAERMRVDFVANASHELRTPLASILGFVETLADDKAGDDPETRARFLKVMGDEAARMQRLVEDLISLSRIEAEKYRPPSQAVDLAELIDEVVAQLLDTHDSRAKDIVIEAESAVPQVVGDRPQLSQLIYNLIGNAMKYGRSETPVSVRLWRDDGGMAHVSVTDQGEGIAPEHIPRLTERFYRADPGRSRALGGTGLGLAIVKHIVERHRGRLDIASSVGTGTIVTVLLPTVQEGVAVIKT